VGGAPLSGGPGGRADAAVPQPSVRLPLRPRAGREPPGGGEGRAVDSGREAVALTAVGAAERVRGMALEAGSALAGSPRPEPIPPAVLVDWLAAGMGADMDWLAERAAARLEPRRLLPD